MDQIVVAWIHQRYLWHTTALEAISHVMFYEDLQVWSMGYSPIVDGHLSCCSR